MAVPSWFYEMMKWNDGVQSKRVSRINMKVEGHDDGMKVENHDDGRICVEDVMYCQDYEEKGGDI